MISDILAILRLEDDEIIRRYKEETELSVMMAVQERIWDLHTLKHPSLTRFTNAVHLLRLEDLPEELHGPQLMLKGFCRNLYTKTHRVREAKRRVEVLHLAKHEPFKNLLTYMVFRRRFSKCDLERHLEHRPHLQVFDMCLEEEYIKPNLLSSHDGKDTYYTTWKAQTLVSDWMKYDLDKTSD